GGAGEVGLALLDEGGQQQPQHVVELLRKASVSGWLRTYSRTGSSRPVNGRSSSTQCGLGRKRQSKTMSTSRGTPCLNPKETTFVCRSCSASRANRSRSRSRSW